jgi:sugar phosphate isomerase/epimerase
MLTRRSFLGEAAGLGLAAACVQRTFGEDKPGSKPGARLQDADSVKQRMTDAGGLRGWRIGAGLNGFMSSEKVHKQSYPIWEVLDFCEKEGFEGIELVQGWPMGNYPAVSDTRKVDALRRLYDRYHLKIYTIQMAPQGRPFAESSDERRTWVRTFGEQIKLAKALGCDFVGTWPGGELGEQSIDQAIDHCAASYREVAKICADEGLWMSFEIEPPFIFHSLEHIRRILAGVDHPAFKTNYDPSHFDLMSGSTGKPEKMLAELGVQHIGHVHLTDTDGTIFEGTSKHLACGDGHCDISASLRVLSEGGYRGWIMIDEWMIKDVYDACRKCKNVVENNMPAKRS